MKNCRNCKECEFSCSCQNPSYFSDGMILTVGLLLLIGVTAALGTLLL